MRGKWVRVSLLAILAASALPSGAPDILNVEADLRSCPKTGQFAVVLALSPKEINDSVWNALRATAGTLVCS